MFVTLNITSLFHYQCVIAPILCCNFSYCNLTHTKTSVFKESVVQKTLPNLFQDDLLCAGDIVGSQGSCKGDSGGPILISNLFNKKWTQIGIVHGAIGECGEKDYPGIYVRLNHPLVLDFITSVVEKTEIKIPLTTKIPNSKMKHIIILNDIIFC